MANTKQINTISEAKAQLSALVKFVEDTGEEVLIGRAGNPVAVLSAFKGDNRPRVLGAWQGMVAIADDFDEPLDAISADFEASTVEPL
ncbi:MAG: type II toxin-antitoxin system prevent-host-death family antitoxin [Gammaproteobacteria bacterium]|nr:type II toxin-antitoxin system prevent-host-death family antitoxin [Gammaproteobacteria bacterium]